MDRSTFREVKLMIGVNKYYGILPLPVIQYGSKGDYVLWFVDSKCVTDK